MITTAYRLSVILPAYNEEIAIAGTIRAVIDALGEWGMDFEVIVVNDGSRDGIQAIVEEIVQVEKRVRLITHPVNQGYGAALVSGFEAIAEDKNLCIGYLAHPFATLPTSPSPPTFAWHVKLKRVKSKDVLLALPEKKPQTYEKHRRLLGERA